MQSNKKWIRCTVDYYSILSTIPIAILWALDYGAPIYSSNFSDMFKVPSDIVFPESTIFTAGLGVLPVRFRFDSTECKEKMEISTIWSERSVETFQKLIDEVDKRGALLQFMPSSKFAGPDHHIGDLIVFDNDIVSYGFSMKLQEAGLASFSVHDEFQDHFSRLNTRFIERWNDNERTGGVLKKPEGVMKLVPLEVDSLARLETESGGVIPFEYLEAVNEKIDEWMRRNSDNYSSIMSETNSNASTLLGPPVEPPMSERPIKKKLEQIEEKKALRIELDRYDIPKLKKSAPIFLPAGSRYPISSGQAGQQSFSSWDDNDFISASQVCNDKDSVEGDQPSPKHF